MYLVIDNKKVSKVSCVMSETCLGDMEHGVSVLNLSNSLFSLPVFIINNIISKCRS